MVGQGASLRRRRLPRPLPTGRRDLVDLAGAEGIIVPMDDSLPNFRYHPDPVATGSIERSHDECLACGRSTGFMYVGPVYAVEDLVDAFCPWCIAYGSAAARFDADFADVGWGVPEDVPAAVLDEIAYRTPGFRSWQGGHWLYHCREGCAFLGDVGTAELQGYPDGVEALRREADGFGWDDEQITEYLESLRKGGSPTAYLFRCLVCGTHLAYSDFD